MTLIRQTSQTCFALRVSNAFHLFCVHFGTNTLLHSAFGLAAKGYGVVRSTVHLCQQDAFHEVDCVVDNTVNLRNAPNCVRILNLVTGPVALYK